MTESAPTPNTSPDPFEFWRKVYEVNEQAWTKVVKDATSTQQYAEAQGKMLETFLAFQKMMRDGMTVQLNSLNLTTRDDVSRLGELIISLEEKIDQLDDSVAALDERLPALEKSVAGLEKNLARKLDQVEERMPSLEKGLAGVEKNLAKKVDGLEERFPTLDKHVAALEKKVDQVNVHISDVEKKLPRPGQAGEKAEKAK